MIVFLVGWSEKGAVDGARAEGALREYAGALPLLEGAQAGSWRAPSGAATAAWLSDPPERVGGARYVAVEDDRLALWAGRPVRWEGDRADGRAPLRGPDSDGPGLDGRCTGVRWDDGVRRFEAFADPLGAYPLYRAQAGGAVWVGNRVEPLRALAGSRAVDPSALAALVGGGWPLGGRPAWSAVERVAPRSDLLAPERTAAMCGAGWDPQEAAALLVENVRALADWPGRPSLLPVTGGRDSRLVLAAALRAGIAFEAATGGAPGDSDVAVARELCRAAGIEHSLLAADAHGDPWATTVEAARVLGLSCGGTASLADAAGFPLGPWEGPRPLWHSGQGGEIARGYYRQARGGDRDATVAALERVFCGRRPGRADPLCGAGRALVGEAIGDWADRRLAAGARVEDLPDLFYLDERMGSWASATHGAVEWVRDTTSPLWSAALLPHLLGGSATERDREAFHDAVLRELAPELAELPYAGGSKRGLAYKARRALQEGRRVLARDRAGEPDPFTAVLARVREAVAAAPGHVAWQVLDRRRVDGLLARDAGGLDEMSRSYVWRLATVFLDPALTEAEV